MTLPVRYWRTAFDTAQLKDQIDRLFDGVPGFISDRDIGIMEGTWSPAMDIYDSKDNILVKAEVPGMSKEDITVTVQNNILTIQGERKKAGEAKGRSVIREEHFYGSFHRSISLPTDVDPSKVTAAYKNGVIDIVMPKKEEAKPKQIKIEVK
jgi:HSP20 family protein